MSLITLAGTSQNLMSKLSGPFYKGMLTLHMKFGWINYA